MNISKNYFQPLQSPPFLKLSAKKIKDLENFKRKKVEKLPRKRIFYSQKVKSNFLIGDKRELLDDDETC
jgi:hypothetical protein